jgi:hypothetical protein|tara:strand:+ start:31 stop:381 length:351 start_codon:yes stop_codon:yes gene_type:complete
LPFSFKQIQPTVSNVPLLYPIRVICPQGVQTDISFPDQFLGRAIALKIRNNDGANTATYDYNLNRTFASLAASTFDTIDGAVVNYLTVIAGAAGSCLVEAQVLPLQKSEPEIEVQV